MWIVIAAIVIYLAVVCWLAFPLEVDCVIYVEEPLIIWGFTEFFNNHGADVRTLIAILILDPVLAVALPMATIEVFIEPLTNLI